MIPYLNKIISFSIGKLAEKFHEHMWEKNFKKQKSSIELDEIKKFLLDSGVQDGSTIFVHSSWQSLDSGNFTATDLIQMLRHYVGENGTLAMPAFPEHQKANKVFNVRRTPSAGGLLTEVFRRYPNVERSINLNHSICAIGKNAEYLISEHHLCETSWDKKSPYYKITQIENAWIIGLGVGHRLKIATSLHCVESLLRKSNPYFKKLFKDKICYKYIDKNKNEGKHCFIKREGQIYTPKLAKFFSKKELIEERISGVDIYAIRASTLVNKAIKLAQEGRTMYLWPIPFSFYFKK